ncbi:MAG TPA: hypothetical protein VE075_01030 [Thermoanaerobaculia bacterium]|nr:hypothetical protein [Thermoanaerobaculia bacterium]
MARRGSDDGRLQAELERLHALPPPAFTAARDELAARLRQEGRRDAAAAVKALPRPTPSSWAVSRLMRLEPERFKALLAAGRQARQAQGQVMGGGRAVPAAPAARLREALQSARTLLEELRRRGLELLAATGRPATAASEDRLSADLQALAFTAGAESAIERGWLDHDLDAPGFEVLAGLQAAAGPAAGRAGPRGPVARLAPPGEAPPRAGPGRRTPAAEASPRAGPAREESRQRQDSERREREHAALQLARDRQRARLANAEAEVQRAAAESERLAAAAATAEEAATAARRRAAEAQHEAEKAGRGAEQARRVLDRARERLQAVRAAAESEPKLRAT